MRTNWPIVVITLVLWVCTHQAEGQTCCSAGAPLLGNSTMMQSERQVLQTGLTSHFNRINHFINGSERLTGNSISRMALTEIVELDYGVTRWLAFHAQLPYIFHWRFNELTETINTRTKGLSDVVLLAKADVWPASAGPKMRLLLGGGVKMPTGASALRQNGILLPADIQPGTGAWDGLFQLFFQREVFIQNPARLIAEVSFRMRGLNDRYGSDFNSRNTGNEWIAHGGAAYDLHPKVFASLLGRYRFAGADQFGGQSVPNTGGHWLYLMPGAGWRTTGALTVAANAQVPVYRHLTGSQLTTGYVLSLNVRYRFNFSKTTTSTTAFDENQESKEEKDDDWQ